MSLYAGSTSRAMIPFESYHSLSLGLMNITAMSRNDAEAIALNGLIRLAGDEDLTMRFSALTGIAAMDMREAAKSPQFLTGVLDFFLGHEPDLINWCESSELDPSSIVVARQVLSPEDHSGFE